MNGLRDGLNYLHQLTKDTKNRITVRQAQYDLIDKNLVSRDPHIKHMPDQTKNQTSSDAQSVAV